LTNAAGAAGQHASTERVRGVENTWFSPRIRAAVLIAVSVYLAILVAQALTRRPINDEGMFAMPAWTFAQHGYLGSPHFDEEGWRFKNVNLNTYYMFPLFPVLVGIWYKIAGFGLFQLRVLSIIAALGLGFALYRMLRVWNVSERLAVLAVALALLDYHMLVASAFGRYDVMVAALGFGGYATYLRLRRNNLVMALLLSNTLIAAAGCMHPNGLMYFLVLWGVFIRSDWRQLGIRHIAAAAAPFVAGGLLWAGYILRDPEAFKQQLTKNSYSRIALTRPVEALVAEIEQRYMPGFGFPAAHSAGHSGPIRLKVVPLIAYIAGIAACMLIPVLRASLAVRTLLLITGLHFTYLTFFEGIKFTYYLVHIVPLFGMILAFPLESMWARYDSRLLRLAAASVIAVLLGIQVGGILLRVRINTYGTAYAPTAEFLANNVRSDEVVNASCEMGFAYGFRRNLIDDIRFGFATGYKSQYIVLEEFLAMTLAGWGSSRNEVERQVHAHAMQLLANEYEPVFERGEYKVFRRKAAAGPSTKPEEWRTAHRR
jgi:hypothetical protein